MSIVDDHMEHFERYYSCRLDNVMGGWYKILVETHGVDPLVAFHGLIREVEAALSWKPEGIDDEDGGPN